MKSEHALNSHLAKLMRRKSPELKYLKTSDKFAIGISDFLLWWDGPCRHHSAAIEVKFIKEYPKRGGSKLLSHPFSGVQISYLHQMACAASHAYGLVGVDCEKLMYVVPYKEIPEPGNWANHMFQQKAFPSFDFKDLDGLLGHIFQGDI